MSRGTGDNFPSPLPWVSVGLFRSYFGFVNEGFEGLNKNGYEFVKFRMKG
jgi:hypothetical protein